MLVIPSHKLPPMMTTDSAANQRAAFPIEENGTEVSQVEEIEAEGNSSRLSISSVCSRMFHGLLQTT